MRRIQTRKIYIYIKRRHSGLFKFYIHKGTSQTDSLQTLSHNVSVYDADSDRVCVVEYVIIKHKSEVGREQEEDAWCRARVGKPSEQGTNNVGANVAELKVT